MAAGDEDPQGTVPPRGVTFGDVVAQYEALLDGIRPNSPEWNKRMEVVHDLRLAYRVGYRDGEIAAGRTGAQDEETGQ